jgi:hypothetical protein
MSIHSYLGGKGYTILKKELSREQLEEIKNELIAKPIIINNCGGQHKQVTFPIYRESLNKIYVPRYYGIKKFHKPKEIKLSDDFFELGGNSVKAIELINYIRYSIKLFLIGTKSPSHLIA